MGEPTSGSHKRGGVPAIVLFALTLTFASVSIDETVLFPFIPQQVVSFNLTTDKSTIGYYAGFIGSSYYVGTILSSSPWGLISDRIGRKPVLILGILSNIFWSTLYGFSGNLWQAIAIRFCNGLFGGLYPVGKAMVAEIPDSSNPEGVYFTVGLGWALGFLFGPAIGGFLSEASRKYPSIFPAGSWVDHHPFALPCVVVAAIALINLICVALFLPETLGRAKPDSSWLELEQLIDHSHGPSNEVTGGVDSDCNPQNNQTRGEEAKKVEEEDPGWFIAFFGNRETVTLSIMYAIMGFTVTSYTEVFALWAETKWENGGLNFNTSQVGIIQASAGPLLILYQIYIYAPMANFLGPLTTLKLSLAAISALAGYPVCRLFKQTTPRLVAASIFMASRGVSVTTGYTTFLILIANSVRYPKYLGAVNGISQAIQMILMAVAPAAGSSLYAWSITGEHVFLFDYRLYWYVLGLLCVVMLLISYTLPISLNHRKYLVNEKIEEDRLSVNTKL